MTDVAQLPDAAAYPILGIRATSFLRQRGTFEYQVPHQRLQNLGKPRYALDQGQVNHRDSARDGHTAIGQQDQVAMAQPAQGSIELGVENPVALH